MEDKIVDSFEKVYCPLCKTSLIRRHLPEHFLTITHQYYENRKERMKRNVKIWGESRVFGKRVKQ